MVLLLREFFAIFVILLATLLIQIYFRRSKSNLEPIEIQDHGKILNEIYDWFTSSEPQYDKDEFPNDAVEVRNSDGTWTQVNLTDVEWFASSMVPRYQHPTHVKFHVGEVVYVERERCRAVVVGWDLQFKAPISMIEETYGSSRGKIYTPHYLIFLDTREMDLDGSEVSYVIQDELDEVRLAKKVYSDKAELYFEGFNGKRHVMRPWLKRLYPNDG